MVANRDLCRSANELCKKKPRVVEIRNPTGCIGFHLSLTHES